MVWLNFKLHSESGLLLKVFFIFSWISLIVVGLFIDFIQVNWLWSGFGKGRSGARGMMSLDFVLIYGIFDAFWGGIGSF